jgi:dolichyl-phosphate-mannose-protein mannosyltransferase
MKWLWRWFGISILLVLAVGLRAWGLSWGVPHLGRYYPYHPDETVLLHAVCSVNPLWGDFAPSFYNYGSLYIFLVRLVYDLMAPFVGWGAVPRFDEPFAFWLDDYSRLLLVGRWSTVVLGTATVPLTFYLACRLFGQRAGWLAAGFLAVAPMPVLLGHYMTVDVPQTFFTTLALVLAAVVLHSTKPQRVVAWAAAAGFAAGLATGVKYNGFIALLSLAAPVFLVARETRPGGRRTAALAAGAALLTCVVGFLVSTPGMLLQPVRFQRDTLFELALNRNRQVPTFMAMPPAALYHLGISLPVGLEWPLFLLGLVGAGWSLRKRRPGDALLWLFMLPFFLPLAMAERKFVHYVMPLLPPLLVLAARCVDEGLAGLRKRVWALAAGLAGLAALASTIAHLGVLAAPDARDQALAFLQERVRPRDTVALASYGWFYTPPVHPTAGCTKLAMLYGGPPVWDADPPADAESWRLEWASLLVPSSLTMSAGSLPVETLRRHRAEWVVVTDYEYEDPLRIRRADPSFRNGMLELLGALEREYVLEQEIRPRPSLSGLTWWSQGIPPHDWRYYMPTVRIYRRR